MYSSDPLCCPISLGLLESRIRMLQVGVGLLHETNKGEETLGVRFQTDRE